MLLLVNLFIVVLSGEISLSILIAILLSIVIFAIILKILIRSQDTKAIKLKNRIKDEKWISLQEVEKILGMNKNYIINELDSMIGMIFN
ncbi:MAG: hypothetical protein ACK5HR_02145 [Mycoplasmatales bacterium]